MAIIECPECGHRISDTCAACPSCGYEFSRRRSVRNSVCLKSGAIVNLVGVIGFFATWALLTFLVPDSGEQTSDFELSVSTSTLDSQYASIFILLCLVAILGVAVISTIILFTKNPTRKLMLPLTSVQLIFALLASIPWIVLFNFMICCGMWLYTWGIILQLVGSIMCLRGALKIE